jgi:hypothetical protein
MPADFCCTVVVANGSYGWAFFRRCQTKDLDPDVPINAAVCIYKNGRLNFVTSYRLLVWSAHFWHYFLLSAELTY